MCINSVISLLQYKQHANRFSFAKLTSYVGLFFVILSLFILPGCGEVEPPDFQLQGKTRELMPEAKAGLVGILKTQFGTPKKPRVPSYLPINLGDGITGTVNSFVLIESKTKEKTEEAKKETDEETKAPRKEATTLTIQLDDKTIASQIVPGLQFSRLYEDIEKEFLATQASEGGSRVVSFNASSGELVLDNPIAVEGLKGAKFSIDAEQKLLFGQKIYKKQCMHCHGFSGDGKGPTAGYMNPKPRDFRLGKFKFTSTAATERASHADLLHILDEGIPGTFMPSFKILPQEKQDAVVLYVKYLAMRGELEKKISTNLSFDYSTKSVQEQQEDAEDEAERKTILEEIQASWKDYHKEDLPLDALGILEGVKDDWERADSKESIVTPSIARPKPNEKSLANPTLTSLQNGRKLFLSKKAQCVTCHGKLGHGDGLQTKSIHKKDGTNNENPTAGLYDEWGNPSAPRDLARGIFRGGRRPIDIYRRIYAGIKGTKMIPFGGTGLKDEEIWDLVNYLLEFPNLKNGELDSQK